MVDVLIEGTVPLWLFVLLNIICIVICIEWYLSDRKKEGKK